MNLHFHILFVDGVYTIEGGTAQFHRLPTPSAIDINNTLNSISKRVLRFLEKTGYLTKGEEQGILNLEETPSGLDRIAGHSVVYRIAYGPKAGQKVFTLQTKDPEPFLELTGLVAKNQGFSMHAATVCEKHERQKLEFLCRYISRPAIAAERLSIASNGDIIYKLKTTYSNGTTHLRLSQVELIEKLAALVPRPRIHLVRFHGLFAPHSKHRSLIVPKDPPKNNFTVKV